MPLSRNESVKRLGKSGAEARAAGPFAQTMVEPEDDPFHVHVEVVAGREIGRKNPASRRRIRELRRARRQRCGRHRSGRLAQGGAPASDDAIDPLHECVRKAEIGIGVTAGEHGRNRHARTDEGQKRDLFCGLLLVPLPIAQQYWPTAARPG